MKAHASFAAIVVLTLLCIAWQAAGRIGALPDVAIVAARMALDPHAAASPETLDWQPLDQRTLAGWRGPYWLEWELRLSNVPPRPLALQLSLRGASEAFWEGRALGRNGRVARDAADEVPGLIDWLAMLPADGVADGTYRLRVRASSHRGGSGPRYADAAIGIGPADVLLARRWAPWLIAAAASGALLVAALYFAVTRVRRRGATAARAEACLLLLGMVGLLLPVAEAWRPLVGYAYDAHHVRLLVLLVLNAAAAILLPAYLAARFDVRTPPAAAWGFVAALCAAVWLAPGFDARSVFVHLLGLLAALAITLRVRGAERAEARRIAVLPAAMLALLLFGTGAFLDGLYFIALAVLMVVLLLRHAARLAALGVVNAELQAQRAQLRSQLLHRSIHPHWLMNTLTSLQELIEQAPAHASRMVDLLADEFRRLRAIGERPLIPLAEEIALCRAHLDILGLAHGVAIALDVEGDADGIELPPGVLHAQVENGLTHAGAAACAAAGFALAITRGHGRVVLQLRSAAGRRPPRRGAADAPAAHGTGTQFIEASLEAAFPGEWGYAQHADADRWLGRIEWPCAS